MPRAGTIIAIRMPAELLAAIRAQTDNVSAFIRQAVERELQRLAEEQEEARHERS